MARARVAFALAALLFVAMAVAPLAQAAKSADAPAADAPAADAPAAEGPSGPAAAPGPVGIDGLSDDSDDDSNWSKVRGLRSEPMIRLIRNRAGEGIEISHRICF